MPGIPPLKPVALLAEVVDSPWKQLILRNIRIHVLASFDDLSQEIKDLLSVAETPAQTKTVSG